MSWLDAIAGHLGNVMLWGLVATLAMTTILQGSQSLGLSRLSLSFLAGTVLTGDRSKAVVIGFVLYTIGGWLFALAYLAVFVSLGIANVWLGAALGLLHGLFLLVMVLPLLPHVHPRMASEYVGASASRRLEPPGFMGLNYGRQTPITTLLAQIVYGAILGAFFPM